MLWNDITQSSLGRGSRGYLGRPGAPWDPSDRLGAPHGPPGPPGTPLGPRGTPLGPPRDAPGTAWEPTGTSSNPLWPTKTAISHQIYSARSSPLLRSNLLVATNRLKDSPDRFIYKKATKINKNYVPGFPGGGYS